MDGSIALSSVRPLDSDELGSAEPPPCVAGNAMHIYLMQTCVENLPDESRKI